MYRHYTVTVVLLLFQLNSNFQSSNLILYKIDMTHSLTVKVTVLVKIVVVKYQYDYEYQY